MQSFCNSIDNVDCQSMTRSGLDPESVAVRRHLISALQQEATLIVDQGTYMGDKSEELEDVFGLKLFKFFFFCIPNKPFGVILVLKHLSARET